MNQIGVLAPVVTPCDRHGEVDRDGMAAVCRWLLDAGCDSIFVTGSTGRGPWFSRADRVQACEAAARAIGPEVPLYAGCMANGLHDMLEYARTLRDAGAQAAVITPPGYFHYTAEELERICSQFADVSPLPVLLYDVPVYTGSKLTTAALQRLLEHENIIGLKDSSSDIDRFKELIALAPAAHLLQGKENLIAESLRIGASGIVTTFVHFAPGLFAEIYRAHRAGDAARVDALQGQIDRIYRLVVDGVQKRPAISTLFYMLNQALQHFGVCENVLLSHETDAPGWIAEVTESILQVVE